MTFVYIPSYQSLFLFLALSSRIDSTPVVGSDGIERLLRELGIASVRLPVKTSSVVDRIVRLPHQKKQLARWIAQQATGDILVFGYNAFDLDGFLLVSLWARSGRQVMFKDLDPARRVLRLGWSHVLQPSVWRDMVLVVVYRVVGGVRGLQVLEAAPNTVGIDRRFLTHYRAIPLPAVSDDFMAERLEVVSKYGAAAVRSRLLYVADHTATVFPWIEAESLQEVLRGLPSGYPIKLHPRETNPGFYSNGTVLSGVLPAEFYLPGVRIVVSVSSAVLIQAAHTPGVTSISVLEIVRWTDLSAKKRLSEFLRQSTAGSLIRFPKTTEELINLIRERGACSDETTVPC